MLSLLTLSLHPTSSRHGSSEGTSTSCEELFTLAQRQAVIALVDAALDRLPETQSLPKMERLKWHGYAQRIALSNAAVNADLHRLVRCLDGAGVRYAVFKGQVAAALYPEPWRRNPGDVDFYVVRADYARARQLIISELGVNVERSADADKHETFTLGSTRFELHFRIETFGTRRHQQRFDALIEASLQAATPCRRTVDGVEVPVLPPVAELVTLFKHLFNHLLMEGVGLRQFCDLLVHVERLCPQEPQAAAAFSRQLSQALTDVGYLTAFRAMLAALHRHLGLTHLPLALTDADYRWADALIDVPLSHGSFGKFDRRTTTLPGARQVDTATLALRHCLRFLPLAPTDILGLLPTRFGIALRRCLHLSR